MFELVLYLIFKVYIFIADWLIPSKSIFVEVDNHKKKWNDNDADRCLNKLVGLLNLGLVCPHVLQLRIVNNNIDINHTTTTSHASELLCAALNIVTKRVRDQVKEGGRPFQGADVTVHLRCMAAPGLLANKEQEND